MSGIIYKVYRMAFKFSSQHLTRKSTSLQRRLLTASSVVFYLF